MSRGPLRCVVYANVSWADHERLRVLAENDGVSMAFLVRGAVSDYLESIGEPPLSDITPRCDEAGR